MACFTTILRGLLLPARVTETFLLMVASTSGGEILPRRNCRQTCTATEKLALVLVVGIALFALLCGRGAEASVKKFIDASYSADVKAMLKLVPDDVMEYTLEEEGYDSDEYDEFCEEGEDYLKDMIDSYEDYFGDDWKYSYEIVYTDDVSNKKLRDIQKEYEDEFASKVKDAKTVEVKMMITSFLASFIHCSISIPPFPLLYQKRGLWEVL